GSIAWRIRAAPRASACPLPTPGSTDARASSAPRPPRRSPPRCRHNRQPLPSSNNPLEQSAHAPRKTGATIPSWTGGERGQAALQRRLEGLRVAGGAARLLDLAQRVFALQARKVVDEEDALEVVHLVLDADRIEAFGLLLDLFAVIVEV